MKKFVLIVEYTSGSTAIIVDTPDIVEATNIFDKELDKQGFGDKGYLKPTILKTSIHPLWYKGENKCQN